MDKLHQELEKQRIESLKRESVRLTEMQNEADSIMRKLRGKSMKTLPEDLQEIINSHVSLSVEKALKTRNDKPETKQKLKKILDTIDEKIESMINEIDWQTSFGDAVVIEVIDKKGEPNPIVR